MEQSFHREVHQQGLIYGGQSDPLSMNRYMYARDNPERYVDPTGHGFQMSVTSDRGGNPNDYITTASGCDNGMCTVINTDVSGGYYSQISTTYGTTTDSSGTTTTAFSTTSTDTYPRNGVTTSTTTSWSATTITPNGDEVTRASTNTVYHNSNTANAQLILGVAVGLTVLAIVSGDVPLTYVTISGDIGVGVYMADNPNPTPRGAFNSWVDGLAAGFIGSIFSFTTP